MSEPYWTVRSQIGVDVPPAIEYESFESWLRAWPKGVLAVMEGHEGAMSYLTTPENLIDALAMGKYINERLSKMLDD